MALSFCGSSGAERPARNGLVPAATSPLRHRFNQSKFFHPEVDRRQAGQGFFDRGYVAQQRDMGMKWAWVGRTSMMPEPISQLFGQLMQRVRGVATRGPDDMVARPITETVEVERKRMELRCEFGCLGHESRHLVTRSVAKKGQGQVQGVLPHDPAPELSGDGFGGLVSRLRRPFVEPKREKQAAAHDVCGRLVRKRRSAGKGGQPAQRSMLTVG